MRRISRRLVSTGTLDVVATAVPGHQRHPGPRQGQAARGPQRRRRGPGAPDFIVVDAPAAGHAVTFLASAYGLLDAAAVGPIRDQAVDVIDLLGDPDRCQVMLVTVPEETPVNEAAETAFHLEDRAGVQLAPIVVNGIWADLDLPRGRGRDHRGRRSDPGTLRRRPGRPGRGVSAPAAGAASRPSWRGWPTCCPCPSCGCPTCSRPSWAPRTWPCWRRPWANSWRPRRHEHGRGRRGGRRTVPAPGGVLTGLVRGRQIIICAGPGGVGKTTTAAAIALQAARLGTAGVRGNHRSGQAPGRCPRSGPADQRTASRSRATGSPRASSGP